ncbi:MAG: GNAT family N-acetyltransferase [Proteobacteria bacterium]|nr:GNAT family N-acetyltransferase [Pseudomonadota bacterium]
MNLRQARTGELSDLSALCMRSKALWGYDADFMAACRTELTLGPDDLRSSLVQIAEDAGATVGMVQLVVRSAGAELAKLFVEPCHIRRGVGRVLFDWAAAAARVAGATSLSIESDPAAADFYRRMGAVDAGTAPSTAIPGRALPRLMLTL